jgi:L-seryl-tRNA(Ser) seleniumtransferase
MLSGRRDLIARMRSNSLFRALRADKLVYAALEATLLTYVRGDYDAIPALRMMRLKKDAVRKRAERMAEQVGKVAGLSIQIVDGESVIGGGAAPSAVLATSLLAVASQGLKADELLTRLRASAPPIIARVENDRVLLDLRTVFPEQDALVASALARVSDPNSD